MLISRESHQDYQVLNVKLQFATNVRIGTCEISEFKYLLRAAKAIQFD
jgi:hypothetical protein